MPFLPGGPHVAVRPRRFQQATTFAEASEMLEDVLLTARDIKDLLLDTKLTVRALSQGAFGQVYEVSSPDGRESIVVKLVPHYKAKPWQQEVVGHSRVRQLAGVPRLLGFATEPLRFSPQEVARVPGRFPPFYDPHSGGDQGITSVAWHAIAMEKLLGHDLHRVLEAFDDPAACPESLGICRDYRPRLECVPELLAALQQVALYVREFHAQGLLVGDIKPENTVFGIDAHGQLSVALCDMGAVLRLLPGGSTRMTGTEFYMFSPEQRAACVAKWAAVDPNAPLRLEDIHALGATIAEVVLGLLPCVEDGCGAQPPRFQPAHIRRALLADADGTSLLAAHTSRLNLPAEVKVALVMLGTAPWTEFSPDKALDHIITFLGALKGLAQAQTAGSWAGELAAAADRHHTAFLGLADLMQQLGDSPHAVAWFREYATSRFQASQLAGQAQPGQQQQRHAREVAELKTGLAKMQAEAQALEARCSQLQCQLEALQQEKKRGPDLGHIARQGSIFSRLSGALRMEGGSAATTPQRSRSPSPPPAAASATAAAASSSLPSAGWALLTRRGAQRLAGYGSQQGPSTPPSAAGASGAKDSSDDLGFPSSLHFHFCDVQSCWPELLPAPVYKDN